MSDKDFTPTEPILVDTDAADESKTPATGSPPKLPTPSAPPAPSERPTASE